MPCHRCESNVIIFLTPNVVSGIKSYTRFWNLLMFGSYSVINVIVLLNLLMSYEQQLRRYWGKTRTRYLWSKWSRQQKHWRDRNIPTRSGNSRTKLWMNYFEDSGTLPPPFSIFPPPKLLFRLFKRNDVMNSQSNPTTISVGASSTSIKNGIRSEQSRKLRTVLNFRLSPR